MFIVSQAFLAKKDKIKGDIEGDDIANLRVVVEPAVGDKCERCWMHDPSVGTSSEHPTICNRCKKNISGR